MHNGLDSTKQKRVRVRLRESDRCIHVQFVHVDVFNHSQCRFLLSFLSHHVRLEGTHNEANRAYGDDTPVTFSTAGSERYVDACLTQHGVDQCIKARETLLANVHPQLVVVSPFTRTLQTAHIMFCGRNVPFLVHDLCKERAGKYTCDQRRTRAAILKQFQPVYESTNESIDFTSYGYRTEQDVDWQETREDSEQVTARAIAMMQWLATRPETEIAVVTHSSWLKHLFRAFGEYVASKDKETMHRLAGNAEVRSICLALHKGFYPKGEWDGDTFIPQDKSFRRYRYAPTSKEIAAIHNAVREEKK